MEGERPREPSSRLGYSSASCMIAVDETGQNWTLLRVFSGVQLYINICGPICYEYIWRFCQLNLSDATFSPPERVRKCKEVPYADERVLFFEV